MEEYFAHRAEGHVIQGKLYCTDRDDIRTVILFGHGFGGHKDNLAAEKFAARVRAQNEHTALVTFNWPCHGDDAALKLRLETCDDYLRLMHAYIQENFGAKEASSGVHSPPALYAYANSFGAYLFLKYVSEHSNPFQKIVLRSPAVNMYDVLMKTIMTESDREQIRKGNTVQVGFDRKIEVDQIFLESLKKTEIIARDFLPYAKDILIFHGTRDEVASFDASKAFAEKNGIGFVPIEDGDHRFLDPAKMHIASEGMIAFFGMK
ncbi:MAG: alpha/beta hydrolase [Oscillospiraceae bacterium]|nr:alpha/beta hydrolase [Oscillospiraceae bacterium]